MSVIWTLPIPMNSVQQTTSAVPSASVCPRVTQASQYTVIMSHKGCDCDPNSPDPDSFCPFNQYCKNCKEWDLLTFSLFQSFIIILTPLDVKREKVEDPPLLSVSRKAATVTRASPTLTTSVLRTKSAIRKGTDRGKHYCQLPVPVSIDLSVSPSDPPPVPVSPRGMRVQLQLPQSGRALRQGGIHFNLRTGGPEQFSSFHFII